MKYFTYILLSEDNKHWYVGSAEDFSDRLKRHNAGFSKSTKPHRPWRMVYTEEYPTRSDAVKRELFLKSPKGYSEYQRIKKEIMNSKNGRVA